METLFKVSAGIDVHQDTVVVSIRRRDEREREKVETRTFETFHNTLVQMVAWLDEHEVEVVGLESTGVYWKPVVRELKVGSPCRLVGLVNPAEVKKVPGRKTDVNDSREQRERGQVEERTDPQGRQVPAHHPRAGRVVRRPHPRLLLEAEIRPDCEAAGAEEGDRRHRAEDARGHLLHAARQSPLPAAHRARPLQRQGQAHGPAVHGPARRARLRGPSHPGRRPGRAGSGRLSYDRGACPRRRICNLRH
jgi:transposase